MRELQQFDSASGLRPASLFFAAAAFLVVAGVWVGRVALGESSERKVWEQFERDPPPAFTLADRDDRPLALFVERLDLVLSPNAAWQAHTPRHMAQRVHDVLEPDCTVVELLERMLPDAQNGVVTAAIALDAEQALRVERWLACGSADGPGEMPPIDGVWLEPAGRQYVLRWRPDETLDEPARAARGPRFAGNPLRWSRHIADGLAECLLGDQALSPGDDEIALEEQRRDVWSVLMPSQWSVAVRGFPAERAPELVELLASEHIAYHQMRIERGRDRRYPAGPLEFLGGWRHIDRPTAQRRVLREWGFDSSEFASAAALQTTLASFSQPDREELDRQAWNWLAHPLPLSGLERACDEWLDAARGEHELDATRGLFHFRRERSARARQSRSYFLDSVESASPPRVRTTFDVALARQVRLALDDAMELHRPAVAMAIVVDLATSEVLAVDARSSYELGGFAPLFHEFTPGSTFKVNVMACALESASVRPDQKFDVGQRAYRMGSRTIREAESSKTGVLSAAECLAHSVNAGLAQIGVLVPAEFMRGKLLELGYNTSPDSGLGGERAGYLPALPWRRDWTHASVSFGHELKVTLWQHAAGLAAIVRGGEWRPLQVIDSVGQYGARYAAPRAQGRRVFSAATCDEVRAMMRLGALEGTGRPILAGEATRGLFVGSKTGTAQKVPSEVCVHVELAHNVEHAEARTSCSRACRQRLKGVARPHKQDCYTSSMCLWGRRESDGREVMVLAVIDEPRGTEKYGGRVAGPTALRILREALGATRNGETVLQPYLDDFAASPCESEPVPEAPWALEQW